MSHPILGENHPRMSKVLAMFEVKVCLVTFAVFGREAIEAEVIPVGIPLYSKGFRVFVRTGYVMCRLHVSQIW